MLQAYGITGIITNSLSRFIYFHVMTEISGVFRVRHWRCPSPNFWRLNVISKAPSRIVAVYVESFPRPEFVIKRF